MLTHDEKVAAIAAEVRAQASSGARIRISKGGVSHFVPLPNDPRTRERAVDVSSLCELIKIDPDKRECTAEPGLSFGALVAETLRHGLMPTVVPELEGISLGGAVVGCSVEAMSYRYGGFHDSCLEYEIVSGAGEVLRCSPSREPLLFGMIHGSYGTLGILTEIRFKLVPAKPFVRLEYRRLPTVARFYAELQERCAKADYDFIDGIIHDAETFILCLGTFVDQAPYLSSYRRLNIYYESTLRRQEDFLRTRDYCFRYDADCHWLTRTVPPLTWKPVRLVAAPWFLGSTNLIRWSKRLDRVLALKRRPDVVCDVFIPAPRFEEFFAWYCAEFRFFPLWVVPYRIPEAYPWVSSEQVARFNGDFFLDCAVYGKPNSAPDKDYSAQLEEATYRFGGIKTLISRNHYSRERFWSIYNQPNYEAAKARLDPKGVFPDLYENLGSVS